MYMYNARSFSLGLFTLLAVSSQIWDVLCFRGHLYVLLTCAHLMLNDKLLTYFIS